jgi:hypothetical protein
MAVTDDLHKLAEEDVVFLSSSFNNGFTEVYRGRLRQALDGTWVFNAFTGQNGIVGFMLGIPTPFWTSSESPASGLQINMPYPVGTTLGSLTQSVVLSTLMPASFTD